MFRFTAFYSYTDFILIHNLSVIDKTYISTYVLAAGGGGPPLDTILEYDFTGDTFTQIGTMIETRMEHAISVVQYEDFLEWCQ